MTDKYHDHGPGCQCTTTGTDRRGFMAGCGASLAFALAGGGVATAVAQEDGDGGPRPIIDLLEVMPDNWGEWGDDDELGSLNYLGSEQMVAGMEAVTSYGGEVDSFTLQDPMTGDAIDSLVTDVEDPTTDIGDPMFPGRFPARRTNWADASDDTAALATGPVGEGGMVFADDVFVTPLYLQGVTHIDALGHGWYDGELYNGHDPATTHTAREYEEEVAGVENIDPLEGEATWGTVDRTFGLGQGDIGPVAETGIVGRGVLLDVGRQMGTEGPDDSWLPLDPTGEDENASITLQDLQATADAQGTEIRERDIVLVRTGAIERTKDPDADWHSLGEPGLTYTDDLMEWAHDMEIPYVGVDNLAVEQITHQVTEDDLNENAADRAGTYVLPLHGAFLRDLGIILNEVMNLSTLAEQCAEDGIYEFFYSAGPLKAEMSTGSPINPVVVKAVESDMDGGMNGDSEGEDGESTDDGSDNGTETETDESSSSSGGGDDSGGGGDGGNEATTQSAGAGDGFGLLAGAAGLAGLAGAAQRARNSDE